MKIRSLMLLFATSMALSACGGGDGGVVGIGIVRSTADPNTQPLAAGSYKLTFSAVSTARLDAPISGVEVAVKLPTGLSVSTTTGTTGQILSTSLTPGSALKSTSLAFGSYSASTNTVYLSMATTQEDYRSGQFLNLLLLVPAHSTVTPNDIYSLNATYPHYKVIGLDTITHNTVTMTDKVKTTLKVAPNI